MPLNIPNSEDQRIVIVGGGFAGLQLARRLAKHAFQIVLIDKNNFHQFQPLFYQVAMSGLEPSSISFPLRKLFRRYKNVHIRMAKVERVDMEGKRLVTDHGTIYYHQLILAMGADTNFYGIQSIEDNTFSLKSVSEALYLRNRILRGYEEALTCDVHEERQKLIDIAIVGGGPTGVELAGALAEMKRYILPKEYGEFDTDEVDIHLIQSSDRLLPGMSREASAKSLDYLRRLGIDVQLNTRVEGFEDGILHLKGGGALAVGKVIWAAGIRANAIDGLDPDLFGPGGRLYVDEYNRLMGSRDIFVVGDQAIMCSDDRPRGHPQVAQVAMQQGVWLAKNLVRQASGGEMIPFKYKDKGSMATVGRNKAVADLPGMRLGGFMAWVIWLAVHLFALIGTKNKLMVFLNWVYNYATYDQSLRLIITPYHKTNRGGH